MRNQKCKLSVGDRVEINSGYALNVALGYKIGAGLSFPVSLTVDLDLASGDQGIVDRIEYVAGIPVPAVRFDKHDTVVAYIINLKSLKIVHAEDSQATFEFMGE